MKTKEYQLKEKLNLILPYLNEKQKRLIAAVEASSLGYGGVTLVTKVTGMARSRIHRGLIELKSNNKNELDRIRATGGGRKSIYVENEKIINLVESLIEDSTKGDPMSPLKWTFKSTRQIAEVLLKKRYKISHETIRTILNNLGYSLQGNTKSLEGSHPDRDKQFKYINKQVKEYLKDGEPVISVDAKKRELIGNFANNGQEWRKRNKPRKVNMHDFHNPKGQEIGIPYGVYDQGKNLGWVNVGCDHDTASFAVQSIYNWWLYMGKRLYPKANRLLICADSGGSNGYRVRLWKYKLQEFVNKTGLEIQICHFPRGTSKWNKIEHKLFSYISMNWKAQPLISHEVMVKLISNTKTKKGLKVVAKLDKTKYPNGIKITDEDMEKINIKRNDFHGEWNYIISTNNKKL